MGNNPSRTVETDYLNNVVNQFGHLDHPIFTNASEKTKELMTMDGAKFITLDEQKITDFDPSEMTGAFKIAHRVQHDGFSNGLVLKYIKRDIFHEQLRKYLCAGQQIKIMNDEISLQQKACVLFYLMKEHLKAVGVNISNGFVRPVGIDLHAYWCDGFPVKQNCTWEVIVEPFASGNFSKFIYQNGYQSGHSNTHKVAAAFCHYSYVLTAGYTCVADIQGTDDRFLDVCTHTAEGKSGFADGGAAYRASCGILHECNEYCVALDISSEQAERRTMETVSCDQRVRALFDRFGVELGKHYIPFHSQAALDRTHRMRNDGTIAMESYYKQF